MSDQTADDRQGRLVRDAIASWRDGLVNLSRTNRLLNFRAVKTSAVPIVDPDPAEIVRKLVAGAVFSFRGPSVEMSKEPEPEPGPALRRRTVVLRTSTGGNDLSGALRNLLRKSHQEYLDRGLRILYLAVGTLEWADVTGMEYSSPLLLIPAELESTGPRQLPHLKAAEDDAVLNPALALKLGEMDIRLPAVQDLDAVDPATVLDQVRSAVAGRRGWRVEEKAVLSYFTFAKEAMYRDLLDNEARIAAHPAITALAAGGRGEQVGSFGFDEIEDRDVDRLAPADRTPLVLDADSSQRACIAAAVEGRSFVMDGPPGTGKSQTIANMIGALLHAGRTVLFVSEKAAALDVVRNRLTDVGLDTFLLELHSSKATRKEVAAELGRSLTHRPVARAGMSAIDREQLQRRQDELNRYTAAMNEPREPLGMSVHAVVGRLSQLAEVPSAPRTGNPVAGLTPAVMGEIMRTSDDLARAWRPALEGTSYLWRGVRPSHALTSRLQAAQRALDAVVSLLAANEPVAAAFGMTGPADAERLAALLEHHAARPHGVPERWIDTASEEEIAAGVGRLVHQIDVVRQRQHGLENVSGASWEQIPPDGAAALDLRQITDMTPEPLPVDRMTLPDIDAALARLRSDAERLRTVQAAASDVAGLLRLPVARTFDDVDRLLEVAVIAADQDRPEAAWFFPRGRDLALQALNHLSGVAAALDAAETAARRYYDDSALQADAAALDERFRTLHSGLRRLGGAYRQDKATVAAFTRDGVSAADAHQHLALVVEWQRATAAWDQHSGQYQHDLGSYFAGRGTERDRVSHLIDRAGAVAQWFPSDDLRGVVAQVSANAPTAPLLGHARTAAWTALADMRNALAQVVEFGPRPQLLAGGIDDARAWITGHVAVLSAARGVLEQVDAAAMRTSRVDEARRLLALRVAVDEAVATIDADADLHRRVCGLLYDGMETDLHPSAERAGHGERGLLRGRELKGTFLSRDARKVPFSAPDPGRGGGSLVRA